MSLATRLLPETLRSLAFGGIGAGYAAIGTAFAHPAFILHIQNGTDQAILFSFDGVNDHEILPTTGFLLLDVTANKSLDRGIFIGQGTIIYAKQTLVAPGAGSVYVAVFYGANAGG